MNAYEILAYLKEVGGKYPAEYYPRIISYFQDMMDAGRIICLFDKEKQKPAFIACFSIADDPEPFLVKDTWQFRQDDLTGKTFYVEMGFGERWTKEMRNEFAKMIDENFPWIETVMWHRWADWGDRKVIVKRRLQSHV